MRHGCYDVKHEESHLLQNMRSAGETGIGLAAI